jgi:hypothetical protein
MNEAAVTALFQNLITSHSVVKHSATKVDLQKVNMKKNFFKVFRKKLSTLHVLFIVLDII